MTPGNLEDWLTEYASGSLSHDKERALFAAAMEDQDLFNRLMDQHAIREMLDQPEARQELARWLAREMQALSSWFRVRDWLAAPRGLVLVGASAILLFRSKISPRKNAVATRRSRPAWPDSASKLAPPSSASSTRPSPSNIWHNKFCRSHFNSWLRVLVAIFPITASASPSWFWAR